MSYIFEEQLLKLEKQIHQQIEKNNELKEQKNHMQLELDQTIAKMTLLNDEIEKRSHVFQDEIDSLKERNQALEERLKKIISRLETLSIEHSYD